MTLGREALPPQAAETHRSLEGVEELADMRVLARFCLGIVLGFTCGAVPLAVAHFIGPQVDPFDHGIS